MGSISMFLVKDQTGALIFHKTTSGSTGYKTKRLTEAETWQRLPELDGLRPLEAHRRLIEEARQ